MAPLVRRTWARRGHTPVLYQRTYSHQKVSVIGALCITPEWDEAHFYFRLHPNANINGDSVRDFLRQLVRQVSTPIVLLWDRLQAHRGKLAQTYIRETPGLHAEFFPPYAPELNPAEQIWNYLKNNPMANLPIQQVDDLADVARHHGRSLQRKQCLLRSLLAHTPLNIRLKQA